MLSKSQAAIIFSVLGAACVAPAPNRPAPTPPEPGGADQEVVVADSDREIWPDAAPRTVARLGVLHTLLARYFAQERTMPASLEIVIGPDGVPGMDVSRDGWGRAWRYMPARDDYSLRSAGPDGRMDTQDDIAISRTTDFRYITPR